MTDLAHDPSVDAADDLPRWSVADVHESVESRSFTDAMERVGADVDRLNDRGQAPVAGAVFKGEDAVVRVLVEAGADPLAGHPTAVDTARMFGREDLLALLTAP